MDAIFKTWMPDEARYGIADTLRCIAMVVQEEMGREARSAYIAAAIAHGYNPKTAACCWAFVQRQAA
jgi:hypothetical protein